MAPDRVHGQLTRPRVTNRNHEATKSNHEVTKITKHTKKMISSS
jgi:hypothetical protein